VSEKRGLGSLFDHLASLVADCQDFSALRAALGLDGHQKADVFANVTKVVIKDEAAMDREYWKAAAKPIARTCLGAATANAIKQVMRAVHSFEHPVEPFGRPGAALTTRRLRPKNAARSEALAAASGWTRTQVLTKTTQQQLHVCVCVCVCALEVACAVDSADWGVPLVSDRPALWHRIDGPRVRPATASEAARARRRRRARAPAGRLRAAAAARAAPRSAQRGLRPGRGAPRGALGHRGDGGAAAQRPGQRRRRRGGGRGRGHRRY
jgi:hypothetical protein